MWVWWVAVAGATDCGAEVVDQRIPTAEAQVAFASRSAELTEGTAPAVEAVTCLLAGDPALTVQVEVHTDSMGSGAYNLRMSQERADALRAALIAGGADGERITAVGYGETVPLQSNSTVEGRAANRRIELHTCPASERPPPPESPAPAPAPEPTVAPAPEPAPPADLCTAARVLRPDRLPISWPGADCSETGGGWSCTAPQDFESLAETLSGCLEVQRDGEELWLKVHGSSMRFAPHGSGIRFGPR